MAESIKAIKHFHNCSLENEGYTTSLPASQKAESKLAI